MLASLASRPLAAFPVFRAGRLPHHSFRGLRSVHIVAARVVAEPPMAALVVGVLQPMSLPPSSAPTATGWSDSCRAGFAPTEEWHLVTAHVESTTGAVAVGRGGSCSRRLSPMPVPHSSPWLRFQSPLVEPDMQISRIRLSDEIMPSPTESSPCVAQGA